MSGPARVSLRPRTVRDQVRPRQHPRHRSARSAIPSARSDRSTSPARTARARSPRWSTPRSARPAIARRATRRRTWSTSRSASSSTAARSSAATLDRGRRRRARRRRAPARAAACSRRSRPSSRRRRPSRSSCSGGRGVEVAVLRSRPRRPARRDQRAAPVATAITSIGFDHQQYLGIDARGDRRREGRHHQAGCAGRGRRDGAARRCDVIAATAPASAARRSSMRADGVDARCAEPTRRRGRRASGCARRAATTARSRSASRRAPVANAVVAVALLEALDAAASTCRRADRRGLERVSWPGRLDLRRLPDGREALLDAAHNPAGAAALARLYRPRVGSEARRSCSRAMRDKDVAGCCARWLPAVGRSS